MLIVSLARVDVSSADDHVYLMIHGVYNFDFSRHYSHIALLLFSAERRLSLTHEIFYR